MKIDTKFIIEASVTYAALSAAFSVIGIFFVPERTLLPNPLTNGSLNVEEVIVHIIWGLIACAVTLRLKYFLLGGLFAVLVDSDHLVNLLNIEALSRMSHSMAFGMISVAVIMLVFGRKDLLLGATAFAALLSHMSYDIFVDDTNFPLFTPFYNGSMPFHRTDWIFFEIAAVLIMIVATIIVRRQEVKRSKMIDT